MKRKTLIIVLIFLVLIISIALKIYIDKTTFNFYGTIEEISPRILMNVQPKTENGLKGLCYVPTNNVKILDSNGKNINISDLKIGDKIVVTTRSDIINLTSTPSLNQVKKIKVLKDNWIIKEVKVDINSYDGSMAILPKWDEMTISQQFNEVEYNSSKYSSRMTKLSNNNILKNIGNTTLTGYDTYSKTTYNKKAELYSIKDIEEKCAIAVKFEGDSDYYVYVNTYYRPATLGEFMKDLNLEEIISFGTIHYNYWDEDSKENINIEFYDVAHKAILQKLFSNKNLENIYNDNDTSKYTSERFKQSINISVDIPLLGYKNISVSLTDKGYLLTNILDTGKGFFIGEDKVQEFLNYIKANYDGYKIVYVYESGKEIIDNNVETENNIIEEQIMMTENTVNGYVTKKVETDKMTSNENKTEAYVPNN